MGMPTYDIIGITSHGLFWTMVETNVALIAFCLPTLRPILSMAALGTAIAPLGRFFQGLGSGLGSMRSQTRHFPNSYSTGRSSKLRTSLHGAWRSRNSNDAITQLSGNGSKTDLIEMDQGHAVNLERHVVERLSSHEKV
jgi:hypothetical protein